MTTLSLTSNEMFLCTRSQSGPITVYECLEISGDEFWTKGRSSWKPIGRVGPNEKFNALEIFGAIIEGSKIIQQLITHLHSSKCLVNREGFSVLNDVIYDQVRGIREVFKDSEYLRLNDLFPWSKYGVTVPTVTTAWNRIDFFTNKKLVSYEDSFSELHNKLQEKEKELSDSKSKASKCKEELEEKNKMIEEYIKEKQPKLESKMEELLLISKKNSEEKNKLLKAKNKEVEDLKAELCDMKKRLEEKDKVIEEYRKGRKTELELKQEELSICNKDSEETKKLLEEKKKEVEDLKAELCDMKKKLEEKNKDEEEMGKLREEVVCRDKRIGELKVAINSLLISLGALNEVVQNDLFNRD